MEKYYRTKDVEQIICKLMREPYYQHEGETFKMGVSAVEGELMLIEEVEIKEQRFGKWIADDPGEWECSLCHYEVERWNNTPYCPCCGAKMETEK